MRHGDHHDKQVQVLRDRLSRMSEAYLRISENLDLDSVLQGVIDSARSLSGASYGGILTVDEAGQPRDFVSSGLRQEEHWKAQEPPEGRLFFHYLLGLSTPLRVPDVARHFRSVGLPEFRAPVRATSFMATPLRNQGAAWGVIYLANGEDGREFTAEDEEMVVMFASHAALVIANARRYREEQRARAGLQTLIDTSPVGVAVFDAETGAPLSSNREAVRIMQDILLPGRPPEDLLKVLTVRRADGREVYLPEVPIAELLMTGETIRAEEVLLSVPDGRTITVLVNVTPMYSEEGEVESTVVTIQDMTPLEEMERLRAEFLAMVSHELRTPLTSIKGSVAMLLAPCTAPNPAEMRQFFQIIDAQIDRMHVLISDLLDVARIETGTLSVSPEPAEVGALVDEARNGFRTGGGKHSVHVDLPSDLPWVMADRPRLIQVLSNLLSNAARHSPHSTAIHVKAVREDALVAISVIDEGMGIPAERLPHLFRKFSRIEGEEVGVNSGLGLAICNGIVESHGGRIRAESAGPGLGARFTFTLTAIEEAGYVSPAAPVRVSSRLLRQREKGQPVRILVVDDDLQALRYIRETLVRAGYAVVATSDLADVLYLVEVEKPHLALLDLMLPGANGIELMQEIGEVSTMPVIFVSAYGQDHLVSRAFEAGASDYVVKPFSPTELVARIRAALRRRELPKPSRPYVLGGLVIDYAQRQVTLGGTPLRLTPLEYRTLAELSESAGRVLTYGHLLQRVWGTEADSDLRPMRTTVSAIRRRLRDNADDPTYIFTEPRIGYRMPRSESLQEGES